jgi:small subunit ribosomal protein S9
MRNKKEVSISQRKVSISQYSDMATPKKATTKKATVKKVAIKKEAAPKAVKKAPVKKAPVAESVVAPVAEHKAAKEEKAERYVYAVGRRKTAVAQVRLYPSGKEEVVIVNKKPIREYFGTAALETVALSPLKLTGLETAFRVSVVVRGGGLHGQTGAIKLGIARCLILHDPLLRAVLKAQGMLTRDARAVERKKPGLKKARRAPQWAKRSPRRSRATVVKRRIRNLPQCNPALRVLTK